LCSEFWLDASQQSERVWASINRGWNRAYKPFFETQATPAEAVAEGLDLRVKKPIRQN